MNNRRRNEKEIDKDTLCVNDAQDAHNMLLVRGGSPLIGELEISGAKNAALPVLCATILSNGIFEIENCPRLKDVFTLIELLSSLGARCEWQDEPDERQGAITNTPCGTTLKINTANIASQDAPSELVRRMRASFLVLGPLLARFGIARVPLPGGCEIGSRPVNFHEAGLKALGARWHVKEGFVEVTARRLKGADIVLDFPSVTATEHLMMTATLCEGKTIIENAAREPEVEDLGQMLNAMGARIEGLGTSKIMIQGVKRLSPVRWRVIPDRIETGTFMMAVGIAGGDVTLKGTMPSYLDAVITKLRLTGLDIETDENAGAIRVFKKRHKRLNPVDVTTSPYPGFPTDLQAQLTAMMAFSSGVSVVTEQIFENRFRHVDELRRLGADIRVEHRSAIIKGKEMLTGAPLTATDLRASASLVIAGLGADGETAVFDIHHLDRGYERLDGKLRAIGADIDRR